ncbi:MAG: hypothetical protein BIFFINMI_03812 [Phycisphaerae bacterium]|nr:hypothetical protein [Phycisphaerae bacterium]
MKWFRYREYQGNWQREIVLCFDAADRDDPFLEFRADQYRKAGKVVRLQALRPNPSNPPDRERSRRP